MAKTVTIQSDARVLCPACDVADTLWTRFRGLLGRRALAQGEGLLLRPLSSVHTCFMRFPIDVVFLDRDLSVLSVSPAVRPWRIRAQRGARAVLELRAGEARRLAIEPGDQLELGFPSPAVIGQEEEAHALR